MPRSKSKAPDLNSPQLRASVCPFFEHFLRALSRRENLPSSYFSPFLVSSRTDARFRTTAKKEGGKKSVLLLSFFSLFSRQVFARVLCFPRERTCLSHHSRRQTTKLAVIERDSVIYLPRKKKKSILTTPRWKCVSSRQ